MTSGRDRFLQTIRKAVADGNRAGQVPTHPDRGKVGYQGAGSEPVARFRQAVENAGGRLYTVTSLALALAKVLQMLREAGARRVLVTGSRFLDESSLLGELQSAGMDATGADTGRDEVFQADAGVTGVDYLIAETGSIVLFSRSDQPRTTSLLPPIHIAIADRSQLLPDLFDLFAFQNDPGGQGLPASVSLITGPSKTGDIELKLVTGVHGPGEVHVVLIDSSQPQQMP